MRPHARRALPLRTAILSALFATGLCVPLEAEAGLDKRGRWTPSPHWDWGYTAVQLVLLPPGSSEAHSRVLWWQDSHAGYSFQGGMWAWNPSETSDCTASAANGFTALSLGTAPPANVFCSGLGIMGDSRVLVAGGTEFGEVGIDTALIFDPDASPNKWTVTASMSGRRWYPSVTRDSLGALTVSSGSTAIQLLSAGGRASHSSTTTTRALKRVGLNIKGTWESPLYQHPPGHSGAFLDWPSLVVDHTFGWNETYKRDPSRWTRNTYNAMLFGGDSLEGTTWVSKAGLRQLTYPLLPRTRTSDYGYEFLRLWPKDLNHFDLPRSGHTMVPDNFPRTTLQVPGMIVFGGRQRSTAGFVLNPNDVWHVWWDSTLSTGVKWHWSVRSASGGANAPSARFSHAAVYDPVHKRMLVWGGTADGSTPVNDAAVYALDLTNPDAPAWSKPTVLGTPPSNRFGHRLLYDLAGRRRGTSTVTNQTWHFRALLYGGATGSSASDRKDDLWSLWIDSLSTTVKWQQVTYDNGASPPVGRMGHTFVRDDFSDRLVVMGGDVNAANPDLGLWSLPLPHPGDSYYHDADTYQPAWSLMTPAADTSLTGSAALLGFIPAFHRLSDRYAANGLTKTTLTSSPLLEFWYPQHFLHLDGSIIAVGASDTSWRLPPGGGAWECYPASACATNLRAGAAVMYRPGKVMMCGSADNHVGQASKDSRWNDFATASSAWRQSINQMSYSRVNHNLVILPTGKVLALGGTAQVDSNGLAVKQPEIWDPDASSGGLYGQWSHVSAGDTLARHDLNRGYHSAAAVLPTAQVLLVGGNNDEPDQRKAELYCPPYLFKANGDLVPRPKITSAPAAVSWGATFTVCVEDTTGIRRAVLLAPAATTHGLDQNQRFIELAVTRSPYGQKLYVTAPVRGTAAPPGYYLLFLLGKQDGATHYPDVPSIASWIRVQPGGRDTCDAIKPRIMTDFTVDAVYADAADIGWMEHADDSVATASGRIKKFDLRLYDFPITSESSWNAAPQVQNIPTPTGPGSGFEMTLSNLEDCKRYYISMRSWDDNQNLSRLHNSISFETLVLSPPCSLSLTYDRDAGSARLSGSAGAGGPRGKPQSAGSAALEENSTRSQDPMVLTTRRDADGGWTLRLSREAAVDGVTAAEASGITVQVPGAEGGWRTVNHLEPPPGTDQVGLCALRDGGRYVIPSQYAVEELASGFGTPEGVVDASSVVHSRTGLLDATQGLDPAVLNLATGEAITATYGASGGTGKGQIGWHLRLRRDPTAPNATQPEAASGTMLPTRFALRQNVPNPFAAATAIEFQLPRESHVRIEIFDLLGRRVRTLTDASWPAGSHAVTWDRTTDRGTRLSSGVFLYRMTADGFTDQKRMVLVAK